MNGKWMGVGAVLAAAILPILWGCGGKEETAEVPVPRPVGTVVIRGGESGQFVFPGQVQSANRADVSFRVPGQIIELPVNEGDEVRAGQVLARLDPRDLELDLREARAAYDQAEADAKRYQRLYERDAVPLADLELRRAQRDVTRARYEQAQLNLDYATLRAPYAGRVGRRYVENFEDVVAKEPIVSLQNLERLEVVVDVPEHLIAVARRRGEAQVYATFTASGETRYPLTIKEVSAEADLRTQTYQVTFSMEQPRNINILPGMTAQVTVVYEGETPASERTEFLVPAKAVVAEPDGSPFVWIVNEDMTVQKRSVEIGRVAGESQIWVTGGLQAGERIATTGVHHLAEGMEIRFLEI